MDQPQKPLLEQLRELLRGRHYSLRTEESYVDWARRYVIFHGKRHPRDLGADELLAFLNHLAIDLEVSASTQIRRAPPCSFCTASCSWLTRGICGGSRALRSRIVCRRC